MVADAPFSLFRDFMINQYAGPVASTDSSEQCLQRFINNVYQAMKEADVAPVSMDDVIEAFITNIFTYGGTARCPAHLIPEPVKGISLYIFDRNGYQKRQKKRRKKRKKKLKRKIKRKKKLKKMKTKKTKR